MDAQKLLRRAEDRVMAKHRDAALTTWSLRTFLEQVVMDVADELSRQDARITALEERATVDDTSLHEWQER